MVYARNFGADRTKALMDGFGGGGRFFHGVDDIKKKSG